MSGFSKFNALLRKNIYSMKRNIPMTFLEFFFPIIMMIICFLVKQIVPNEEHEWKEEGGIANFLVDKGNFNLDYKIYQNLVKIQNDPFSVINMTVSELQSLLKLMSLGVDKSIWNYTDPLGIKHPTELPTINGLPIKPVTTICYDRFVIGFVGFKNDSELGNIIRAHIGIENEVLKRNYTYSSFETIQKLNDYVNAEDYGKETKPFICFAVGLIEIEKNKVYNASLHYFDSFIPMGIEDVPNNLAAPNDPMQQGPNINAILKYANNGYIQMMTILANYILKKSTNKTDSYINMGLAVQKYDNYSFNKFSELQGMYMAFFVILAYICPLIIAVLKMVVEKESKSKEVMKIMGMGELPYFFSNFFIFVVINLFQSFICGYFMHISFIYSPYLLQVMFLFLYGLNIFSLAFLCQSFMNKTSIAIVISTLIYFVMTFVSGCVYQEQVAKFYKVLSSFFAPVNMFLGTFVMARFEESYCQMLWGHFKDDFENYSMLTCFIMYGIDFFLYIIIGIVGESFMNNEFGERKRGGVLETILNFFKKIKKIYTPKNKNKIIDNNNNKISDIDQIALSENIDIGLSEPLNLINSENKNKSDQFFDDNPNKGNPDFENEDLYRDRDETKDILKIRHIKKIYSDGKCAVNDVSFNLFRNEIFVLLGRNGAGKTSTINVLNGMYNATSGSAHFKDMEILTNMSAFRATLGICPQHDILFPSLTVREHLELFCVFKGFPKGRIEEEVNSVLRDFRLIGLSNQIAGTLSAGQRRKLSIAVAVVGGSEVIFLDEPSSGLDVADRRRLWDVLRKVSERRIVVLTTHNMGEAAVLGRRIGVMAEGKLKTLGTPLFLIERFGKFVSVNIRTERNADKNKIVEFVKKQSDNIECEILTQEILFRIPKEIEDNFKENENEEKNDIKKDENEKNDINNNTNENKDKDSLNLKSKKKFDIRSFFHELDSLSKSLGIHSYSASMPTLEDVFLNVGSSKEDRESLISQEIDKHSYSFQFFDSYMRKPGKILKFFTDAISLISKRMKQVLRDPRTFVLEIVCPIALVLVGCIVNSADLFKPTGNLISDMDLLNAFGKQKIYFQDYADLLNKSENFDIFNIESINVSSKVVPAKEITYSYTKGLFNYIDQIYDIQKANPENISFGSVFVTQIDREKSQYSLVELVNGQARQSPFLYASTFLNRILAIENITFNFVHSPLPISIDSKENSRSLNNACMVFFFTIAFSLIPSNFITGVVRERRNNSKHLMKVSGISLFAYWTVNFLFELVKYYFTLFICYAIILLFDFVPKYFIYISILYGPAVISFSYMGSFLFNEESQAQNAFILFNLVLGSLASLVIMLMKFIEETAEKVRPFQWIFRIIPTFSFGFGYNLLLNKKLILFMDYSIDYIKLPENIIITLKYAGADCAFLLVEAFLYAIILWFIEKKLNKVDMVEDKIIESELIGDDGVKKEMKRANGEIVNYENENNVINEDNNKKNNDLNEIKYEEEDKKNISDKNKNGNTFAELTDVLLDNFDIELEGNNLKIVTNNINKKYALRIKNLMKIYKSTCSEEQKVAVKNLSFCVEYGECFGLLGLNGAGKTTVFRAITHEVSPSHGVVYIEGADMRYSDTSLFKNVFGYCPQTDAVFEYLTVEENLSLFARSKGVRSNKVNEVVDTMLHAMTLFKYKYKLAGKLSGGNRRKLSVAVGLICRPPILLLDEPSTGIDPEARRVMWKVIHEFSQDQKKKNCVVLTTHDMPEAETLCRRMGIMVGGEFVTLGTADQIRELYGKAFEINVRIKPIQIDKADEIIVDKLGVNRQYKVNSVDEVKEILAKIGMSTFNKLIEEQGLGRQIYHEIILSGSTNIVALISWAHYIKNALLMVREVIPHYGDVVLSEFIENSFLFKIDKGQSTKSIGFLFILLESIKEKCCITEYSLQNTSLEQIFNAFAENKDNNEEEYEKMNKEIKINEEMLKEILDS